VAPHARTDVSSTLVMYTVRAAAAVLLLIGCTALPIGGQRPTPMDPAIEVAPAPATAHATPSATLQTVPNPSPAPHSSVPLCADLRFAEAPADWYRDQPIYVGNPPTEGVRAWAARKPGFEELWIDREHNGWIALAFSRDADARQAELRAEFPEIGAVVVAVDWTKAELEVLQRRVMTELAGIVISVSSGNAKGVVSIGVPILTDEAVAAVEAKFAGERVCLEGLDPALAPIEGPQPQAGDGWRLIADQDETGQPYRTGIAFDANSYAQLWAEARLDGDPPNVDFETEVAIWFGAVHGSSCPRIRLDDVIVQGDLVHSVITELDVGICTADAIGRAFVVALQRSRLPHGPFRIQLEPDPPRGGLARTIVDVDLSASGSVARPQDVHREDTSDGSSYVQPGGFIETCCAAMYQQTTHCGLEWLGPLNDVNWRTDEASGIDWLPDAWYGVPGRDQIIELKVRIDENQPPTLEATANGYTVTYVATAEDPPGCD
jgi:hypothetical protein